MDATSLGLFSVATIFVLIFYTGRRPEKKNRYDDKVIEFINGKLMEVYKK